MYYRIAPGGMNNNRFQQLFRLFFAEGAAAGGPEARRPEVPKYRSTEVPAASGPEARRPGDRMLGG